MRRGTTRPTWLAAGAVAAALGCAWVPLDPGAEAVAVRSAAEVADCELLGRTRTRTAERIGPIPRSEGRIEKELESLARNEAVRMRGDSVAPLEEMLGGQQRFGIYRCR